MLDGTALACLVGSSAVAMVAPAVLSVREHRSGARAIPMLKGACLQIACRLVADTFLLALFSAIFSAFGLGAGTELPILALLAGADISIQVLIYNKVFNASHERGNLNAFVTGWGLAAAMTTVIGFIASAVAQGAAGSRASLDAIRCAAIALGAVSAIPLAQACFDVYRRIGINGAGSQMLGIALCAVAVFTANVCAYAPSVLPAWLHLTVQVALCAGSFMAGGRAVRSDSPR